MSIHGHARCDNCEKILLPEREEGINEDDVLAGNWFIVNWEVDGEGDERTEKKADLCCARCVSIWAEMRDSADNVSPKKH